MTRGLSWGVIVLTCCGALTACSAGAQPAAAPSIPVEVSTGPTPLTPAEASEAEANASMRAETRDPWPAVMPAVQTYSNALLGGRAARAYALLSKRCHAALPLDDVALAAQAAQRTYGKPRRIRFTALTQDGDTAVVRFDYTLRATHPTRQTWVFERGHWRNDDC